MPQARNVAAVVRLNQRMYDAKAFQAAGIEHHDMIFPDGRRAAPGRRPLCSGRLASHPSIGCRPPSPGRRPQRAVGEALAEVPRDG
jgi:hypothetical protein